MFVCVFYVLSVSHTHLFYSCYRGHREMDNWKSPRDGYHPCTSSMRDVTYSCGNCGFELNLSSSGRNTSTIGSKYGKSIKRGIISFFFIDEGRFTQVEELRCGPFISKNSWGLFCRRTKLLCRKCGNLIGIAYDDHNSAYPLVSDSLDSASGSEISNRRKYDVRIRALQPSSSDEGGIPLAV